MEDLFETLPWPQVVKVIKKRAVEDFLDSEYYNWNSYLSAVRAAFRERGLTPYEQSHLSRQNETCWTGLPEQTSIHQPGASSATGVTLCGHFPDSSSESIETVADRLDERFAD